ncbi:MAG: universal stress protein [Cyanophyceae cyanobacterium]
MKQFLLCTDGSVFAQASYQYGAWFATRLGAAIAVLHVSDARGQIMAQNLSGSIGVDASETLLNQLVALEHEKAKLNHQRAKLILQEAIAQLKAAGVEAVEGMHRTGLLADVVPNLETAADLIILGKRGEAAEFASGHLGANLERIVRASRRPCLVTSRQFRPIERVLVAYDGSASGRAMLDWVARSQAFTNLAVMVLTVIKPGEEAKGRTHLQEAQQRLGADGIQATTTIVTGNAETAIAAHCEQRHCDLLVMGAYGHNRIRHLVIGSTTIQLLRSSQIPVLLYR